MRASVKFLLKDLLYNIQEYKEYEKEGGFESGLFNYIGRNQTTTDRALSSWCQLLNTLCHLPYSKDACSQLIVSLKDYYKNDSIRLGQVIDFEENYTSENAVHWYTRDIFLYRLLNRAFLLREPQLVFLFGFIVRDLYQQLNEEKEKYRLAHLHDRPVMKVYRGQMMTRREIAERIDFLTEYDRELVDDTHIINNTFLSTTEDRDVAMAFLMPSSTPDDQIQGLLFEIELDIRFKSHPYADITHLSQFCYEREVLITFGCVFELNYLKYNEDEKVWICKLKLIDQLDCYDIKEYQSTNDRRTLKTCVTGFLHGYTKSSVEQGTEIFDMLTSFFPAEKWIAVAKAHFLLSKFDQSEHPNNAEYLQQLTELIRMWSDYLDDSEINCFVEIGDIHQKYLAPHYSLLRNDTFAKEHYELAIISYQLAIVNTSTNYERMKIYELLSWIYLSNMVRYMKGRNEKVECIRTALKYRKLQVDCMLAHPFTDTLKIPNAIKWMASIHQSIDQYDQALTEYGRALNILQTEIKPHFISILEILKAMLKIYQEHKHDLPSVLKYKLIQHEFIVRHVNETPIPEFNLYYVVDKEFEFQLKQRNIFISHIELAHCFLDVNSVPMAKEHLSEALHILANIKTVLWEGDSEQVEGLKDRLEKNIEQ